MTTWTRPNTGLSQRWITPKWITALLGPFDLDPCEDVEQPWHHAKRWYTTNGLERPWRGRVWLNPPFGQETAQWIARLAEHGNGIALTFARTDTRWFHQWVFEHANGLLFLRGRPKFCRPDGTELGNSGGAIVLIAYGRQNVSALRRSKLPGVLITERE